MSKEGVAHKSNNIKKWTQRFLLTSIIQGAIAVSLTIMLAAFVIPPLNSTYSSMTDYNNVDASH
jgi:type II secretory pathway component PulF